MKPVIPDYGWIIFGSEGQANTISPPPDQVVTPKVIRIYAVGCDDVRIHINKRSISNPEPDCGVLQEMLYGLTRDMVLYGI